MKYAVYHSHNESLRQIYRRSKKEAMARKRLNPQLNPESRKAGKPAEIGRRF